MNAYLHLAPPRLLTVKGESYEVVAIPNWRGQRVILPVSYIVEEEQPFDA